MYQFINIFGRQVSTLIVVYSIGGIIAAASFILKREKYNYSFRKALAYALVLIGTGMIELKLMGIIRTAVMTIVSSGEFSPKPSVRIFGAILFQPIVAFVLSRLTGDSFRRVIDSFAPETFLYFIVGKISCHLEGCCHGFPYEKGVESILYGGRVFPVQLCEAASTAVVVAILYLISKDKFKLRQGSLFPIGTIMYSVTRFFWEYFRYYDVVWEKEFFLGMNFWQTFCIISIIVSVIWLVVLYSKAEYKNCSLQTNEKAPVAKAVARYDAYVFAKKEAKRKERKAEKNIVHHKKRK